MAEKYDLIQMGEQALTAKYEASLLTTEQKNTVLTEIAQNLRKECGSILDRKCRGCPRRNPGRHEPGTA